MSGSAPGARLLPAALGLQRPLVHVQGGLHESQASQHLQCLQGGRLGRGNSCDVRGSYYVGCLRGLDGVQCSHLFSAFVLCGSRSSWGWGWCGGLPFTSTGGHPGPANAPAPLSPGAPRLLKRVPHRRASGLRWSASAALMAKLSERRLSAGGLKRGLWGGLFWVVFLFLLPDLTQGWPRPLELCGQHRGEGSWRPGKRGPVG